MTSRWVLLPPRPHTIRHRLIVALDVDTLKEAEALVRSLGREVDFFKVGKQLFLHTGPEVVRMIHRHGGEVFLDLKFHDIPHTVAKAGVAAARLGVRFFDLHASGSFEMMAQTQAEVTRACRREGLRRPKLLAVTVLTSLRRSDLRRVGVDDEVEHQAVRLARLARRAAMDGVVASPLEIARIRRACGRGFLIVTPGVRPPSAALDDQKRVLAPGEAMRLGADYLVIGRPVRDAPDPLAMVREVVADMARGFLAARAGQRAS
ncbi:MAG TPA: orotidine-5'-phosphate decarboxylase [Candidatus Binatia bacterium]|nr:orotidine-5'-phosphate decarboxylase [Candidatus Binatia bacterium]